MTGNEQYMAGNIQHMVGNEDNVTGNEENVTGNEECMVENEEYMLGNEECMAGNEQYLAGNEQYIAGNEQNRKEMNSIHGIFPVQDMNLSRLMYVAPGPQSHQSHSLTDLYRSNCLIELVYLHTLGGKQCINAQITLHGHSSNKCLGSASYH